MVFDGSAWMGGVDPGVLPEGRNVVGAFRADDFILSNGRLGEHLWFVTSFYFKS